MATLSFNTTNQTYRSLMGNGLTYRIPRFQRDYSWDESEWDDLWRDLEEVVESDDNEQAAHYMGYLVLQSRDSKTFDVIDGQQRLTTLTLIVLASLAYLRDLVQAQVDPEANALRATQLRASFIGYLDPVTLVPRSKLTLNRNNDSFFQRWLVPLPTERLPRRNLKATEHLLRKAYEWLQERVNTRFRNVRDGAEAARFIERLADRLFFTVITVADELNAYKVFETLNARGVKLSSTDLLKNYLFSVVHRERGDEREFDDLDNRWEELVSKLGSESFPDFLRAHWNSRHAFVRHSELFKVVRNRIDDRGKVFTLLRELEQDADVYAALSQPEDVLWKEDRRQRDAIGELRMFNVRQVYPLLLAAYRRLPASQLTELLRAISILSFRYNVIGNQPPNEQERVYTSLAVRIERGELNSFAAIVRELRSLYLSDEIFERAFAEKSFKTTLARNKRVVRYILCALESHLGQQFDFDSDRFNLEHVLPENPPETGWEDFPDTQLDQYIYRLGNLALLDTSQNRNLGNKTFAEKRMVYQKSAFTVTRRIGEENREWTPERLRMHQEWMARQATSIWRLSQLHQS